MPPLTRLATAAASNGLLTGQILFSLAFLGSFELPYWINGPRGGEWLPRALDDGQRPFLPIRHADHPWEDRTLPGARPAGVFR